MTPEREREGRIEAAIRRSERDRILAYLRAETSKTYGDLGRLIELADAIERGEHWRKT